MQSIIEKLPFDSLINEKIYSFVKPVISVITVGVNSDNKNRVVFGKYDDIHYRIEFINKNVYFSFSSEKHDCNKDYLEQIIPEIILYVNSNLKKFIKVKNINI
jgi:hypothetical protein